MGHSEMHRNAELNAVIGIHPTLGPLIRGGLFHLIREGPVVLAVLTVRHSVSPQRVMP